MIADTDWKEAAAAAALTGGNEMHRDVYFFFKADHCILLPQITVFKTSC